MSGRTSSARFRHDDSFEDLRGEESGETLGKMVFALASGSERSSWKLNIHCRKARRRFRFGVGYQPRQS
jgi:hypothetical protein